MPRSLTQIMQELNATYNPQRDVYNTQLGELDPQMQAEEKGLQAAQQDAFGEIQQGANRRGLNFSGIPLAEQARYTGSTFLPAVANLKANYANKRFNLKDALAQITQKQAEAAQGIYQWELEQDAAERARAAARASAGGGGYGFSPTLGGGGGGSGGSGSDKDTGVSVPPELQQLYNQVFINGETGEEWSNQDLFNDYRATLDSAQRGNARDKQKIELYHRVRPDIFGVNIPIASIGNIGRF